MGQDPIPEHMYQLPGKGSGSLSLLLLLQRTRRHSGEKCSKEPLVLISSHLILQNPHLAHFVLFKCRALEITIAMQGEGVIKPVQSPVTTKSTRIFLSGVQCFLMVVCLQKVFMSDTNPHDLSPCQAPLCHMFS